MGKTVLAGPPQEKRLAFFERYLTLWVGLCMVAGVVGGNFLPFVVQGLRGLEFGQGSQINVPIAVLIWLMITPMMMKVDFGAIRNVGRKPAGLAVTLVVNWLIKPFSMALLAWLFFRFLFSFDRSANYPAGLHERLFGLRVDEGAKGRILSGCSRGIDWSQQLL